VAACSLKVPEASGDFVVDANPPSLCGIALDDGASTFVLGKSLQHGNHSDIYAIENHTCPGDYEARVFSLKDIPRNLRRYRQRSIARLSSREALRTKIHGYDIVIIRQMSKILLIPWPLQRRLRKERARAIRPELLESQTQIRQRGEATETRRPSINENLRGRDNSTGAER